MKSVKNSQSAKMTGVATQDNSDEYQGPKLATITAVVEELGIKLGFELSMNTDCIRRLNAVISGQITEVLVLSKRMLAKRRQKHVRQQHLNEALSLLHHEPLLGYEDQEDVPYKIVGNDGNVDIAVIPDRYIDIQQRVPQFLLKYPLDRLPSFHWLATNGESAVIAENKV